MDETFTIYRKGSTIEVFDEHGNKLSAFTARCIIEGLAFLMQVEQ